MGLNFTSTKPSFRLVSSLMQTGYVASPDCFRTFGLLGAESSATTSHLGSPSPVLVAVQPGGGAPVWRSSKLTVSASAAPVARVLISARIGNGFISRFPFRERKRGFDSVREVLRWSASPIVKEDHARFFADHVVVDSDNVNGGFAERF